MLSPNSNSLISVYFQGFPLLYFFSSLSVVSHRQKLYKDTKPTSTVPRMKRINIESQVVTCAFQIHTCNSLSPTPRQTFKPILSSKRFRNQSLHEFAVSLVCPGLLLRCKSTTVESWLKAFGVSLWSCHVKQKGDFRVWITCPTCALVGRWNCTSCIFPSLPCWNTTAYVTNKGNTALFN